MERCFLDTFGNEGISPPLYAILILVEANPGCLPSEICREIAITAANIVPYLDQLVARGLILRESGVHDRRHKHLTITPEGRAYLAELRDCIVVSMSTLREMGQENMAKPVKLLIMMNESSPR